MKHQNINLSKNNNQEPFQIIYNVRKYRQQHKSNSFTKRKQSIISLTEEKQRKIKKRYRKNVQNLIQQSQQNKNKIFSQQIQFDMQLQLNFQKNLSEQILKLSELGNQQSIKLQQEFHFHDQQIQRCISEGIGNQDVLERDFRFDFFNPQKRMK